MAAATSSNDVLRLAANLDLREAGPMVAALTAARGADLTLDGSQVRRVGGLCLQALLAGRLAWAEDQQVFRIMDPTPEFRDACVRMGAPHLVAAAANPETL